MEKCSECGTWGEKTKDCCPRQPRQPPMRSGDRISELENRISKLEQTLDGLLKSKPWRPRLY